MKTYVETEEKRHADTELTLGTGSILGIFFGLALICGIFFGLGYSLGRGNSKPVVTPQAALQPPDSDGPAPVKTMVDDTSSPAPQAVENPASSGSKPSGAIAQPETVATATPALSADNTAPIPVEQAEKAATLPPAHAAPVSSPEPSAAIMVQIAAVSHREDANVLVSALGKHGYTASVRSGADNLLHVQVGPFATREEAMAMRAKLLNDGYNAILK